MDALVRHRIGMFADMSVPVDVEALDRAFRAWLADMMPSGTYRAWVVETPPRDPPGAGSGGEPGGPIVAGGGITLLPWPPGPREMGGRLAFVYNLYTEPAHRRRGLARRIMGTIHDWCRGADVPVVALNASRDGQPLYEAMGYQVFPHPMMFFTTRKV